MSPNPHIHRIQVYYEDTDFTGSVYHANYLKYFERAREHMLGTQRLVQLLEEDGIGFVVYKIEATYKKGARFGDSIQIRTWAELESPYRAIFHQNAWRGDELLVEGLVHLVCVDRSEKLTPLPESVVSALI